MLTKYDVMRGDATPCDTIRYDTIRYDTIRYDTIRYDTIRYDTIRYDTIPVAYPELVSWGRGLFPKVTNLSGW